MQALSVHIGMVIGPRIVDPTFFLDTTLRRGLASTCIRPCSTYKLSDTTLSVHCVSGRSVGDACALKYPLLHL